MSRRTIVADRDSLDLAFTDKVADGMKKTGNTFVLVLGNASRYADVKATAELRAGVLTECAQESMVSDDIEDKIIRGMLTKICFKINAKIGGSSRIGCTEGENVFRVAIVIGIGVYHPAPGEKT